MGYLDGGDVDKTIYRNMQLKGNKGNTKFSELEEIFSVFCEVKFSEFVNEVIKMSKNTSGTDILTPIAEVPNPPQLQ